MPNNRRADGARQGHRSLTVVNIGRPLNPADIPEPPRGLLKPTRELWQAFWSSTIARGVSWAADRAALLEWIWHEDEAARGRRTLRRYRLVKGSMGQPVLSPMAGYVADHEAKAQRLREQFGMTPKARLSLGVDASTIAKTAADLNAMLRSGSDEDEDSDDGDTITGEYQETWRPA
jgi:P27 family predicted phage terminase small subunit